MPAPTVAPTIATDETPAQEKKPNQKPKTKDKAPKKDPSIVRHFVSSLGRDQASDARLAGIIRSHWSCEARHWERDTQWREDKCLIRNPTAASALALIRTGLQALLRRNIKQPHPVLFEEVAHHLDLGLNWLKQASFQS